jgi:hypothetical protein
MRALAIVVAVVVAACGGPAEPAVPSAPLEAPIAPATSGAPMAPIASPASPARSIACDATLPPAIEAPPTRGDRRAPYVAGVITEEAAQAKRLFDGERWAEASRVLARVVSGETGDDLGNHELAAYHLGICFFRMDRASEAAKVFAHIATEPSHLKFHETILWLTKLVDREPGLVHSMRFYDMEAIARFHNPNQLDTYGVAAYMAGRERFERGDREDARRFFAVVPPESAYYGDARDCLDRAARR